ncbi:HNH endonuclease [Klebsiella aerogenes]|uniref:HNH endonuclease n=1 Tax=Klebsiella aerogenes TaxID=548 RepID=UPI0028DD4B55|nr:HNH endonuclease [Klebsiella aerogenes]MDT8883122.1 HNH endonuclease [Klebsiella aerogenes]
MISQRELKQYLKYNPDTGVFYWLKNMNSRTKSGDVAGCTCKINGYIRIRINGHLYPAHRLAFVYMEGRCPDMVDHVNRDRKDNRWVNLREFSLHQNNLNTSIKSNNVSGVPGVNWAPANRKWRVTMTLNGIQHSFGYHRDFEFAALVAQDARAKYFGEFSPC